MINQQLSRFATHENSAYPQLWRGCVGAWCPSLGPSGSRLHDFSGRQNWATLVNMDPATDWVVDEGGLVLDFDGSNDLLVVDRNSFLNGLLGPVSIVAWIKTSNLGNSFRTILTKNQSYAINAVDNVFGTYDWTITTQRSSGINIASGTWRCVGLSSRPGVTNGTQLYVDGVPAGSAYTHSVHGGDVNSDIIIGAGNIAAAEPCAMRLAEMRLYARGLHAEEMRLLARRRGIAFTPRARRLAVPEQTSAGGATPWPYARRRSQIIGAGGVH